MVEIQLNKNDAEFVDLLSFTKRILKLCRKIGCKPKLFGSLAYIYYTRDTSVKVNDIDFITSLEHINQIINHVKHIPDITYEFREEEGYLKLLKNGLKVSFEDVKIRPFLKHQSNYFQINGLMFDAIDLKSLIDLYRKGVLKNKYSFKKTRIIQKN